MTIFTRVRVKGTEVTATVLEVENGYAMLALDRGGLEMYAVEELEVINCL